MNPYLKLLLLLALPLVWFIGYGFSPKEIAWGSYTLSSPDMTGFKRVFPFFDREDGPMGVDTLSQSAAVDSMQLQIQPQQLEISLAPKPDSTRFHILFFGDSMLEGLGVRLSDYTSASGCDLTSVIWYSSSTQWWAQTDTLEYFLRKVQPDFVIICLGSNELFVRDLPDRDKYIGRMLQKLSDRPYFWISPPNWREDTGINDLIIKNVSSARYFDSRYLELNRCKDKAHPTRGAASYWMDTIVSWMRSPNSAYLLPLSKGESHEGTFRQYVLQPIE